MYVSPEFQLGQVYDGYYESDSDVVLFKPVYVCVKPSAGGDALNNSTALSSAAATTAGSRELAIASMSRAATPAASSLSTAQAQHNKQHGAATAAGDDVSETRVFTQSNKVAQHQCRHKREHPAVTAAVTAAAALPSTVVSTPTEASTSAAVSELTVNSLSDTQHVSERQTSTTPATSNT